MPIKPSALQRRHAELGRIRLGHKATSQGGKTYPAKLAAFRFTSPSERYIRDLAELYGGEARPWDNNGVGEFEVFTEAKSIPVIVIKGGLSQWMETWSGGGCIHRCDGEVNVLTNQPCNPDDPAHRDAKPTTRLSAMLPELEAIGAWRLETKGWNAAAEIPAVAELALFVGDLVPAHLNLVERRAVKDGKTSRFVVPVLDLQIGTARLREIVAQRSGVAELEGPGEERPALQAPATAAPGQPEPADQWAPAMRAVAEATSHERLVQIWDTAKDRGMVGTSSQASEGREAFVAAWKRRAHELQAATTQPATAPDADGIVDAEFTEDSPATSQETAGPDADAVWQQILAAAGQQGMSTPDLEDDFAQKMGGLSSAEASAAELQHYLGLLTAERAA